MRLSRKKLRILIEREVYNSVDEDILVSPDIAYDMQGTPPLGYNEEEEEEDFNNSFCDRHNVLREACGCQSAVEKLSPCPSCGINHKGSCGDKNMLKHKRSGAYMAKSQLYKITKYSQKMYELIPDNYDLEDWMRSKLSEISDDISEVFHALDHKSFQGKI